MNPLALLPQNTDAEVAVLGGMLLGQENQSTIPKVTEMLTAKHFYSEKHQFIFEAIAELHHQGKPVDYVSVSEMLESVGALKKVGGLEYIYNLQDGTPEGQALEYHASIVRDYWIRREIIRRSAAMYNKAADPTVDTDEILSALGDTILDIQKNVANSRMTIPIKAAIKQAFEQVDTLYKTGSNVIGLASGFEKLDDMTSGFHPGDYILIAGRPSMGKSTIAQNIVQHCAIENSVPTLMFSLEMSALALSLRLLSSEAAIDFQSVRTGAISESGWPKLAIAAAKIAKSPLVIDQRVNMTPSEIRNTCYKVSTEMEIGLIVVDYLQLLSLPDMRQNRTQEVTEISKQLKDIARRFDAPLIAVSQLSRAPEARNDKRPQLSDLRESGSLEQDADVVLLLYREKYYDPSSWNDLSELIVAKQRNGPTGLVKLGFDGSRMKFRELGG